MKFRSFFRSRDKSNYGYIFITPFITGFIVFFLYPFILSIRFSFSDINIHRNGFELVFVGLKHYEYILFVSTEFVEALYNTFMSLIVNVPMIIFFSFFAAILLNQRFRGRTLARVIFFLPVILGAGIVLQIEQNDLLTLIMNSDELVSAGGVRSTFVFSDASIRAIFLQMKMPVKMIEYLMLAVDNLALIIRSSGVQILIFLAGLQSITPSLYEAADVEGATSWEKFWTITFPLMTPMILTNIVYTIIDSFTSPTNELMVLIDETAFEGANYGVSVAMAWFYFLLIAIVLAVVVKIISKGVVYQD